MAFFDQALETASRDRLIVHQIAQLQSLLDLVGRSPFYERKLREVGLTSGADVRTLEDLRRLPFTTKSELVDDQESAPPFGSRLTEPVDRYARLHQTSGTTGKPLRMVDTPEAWDWWLRCWSYVYCGAGVGPTDRVFAAFSFGPFIGFWAGFEAASRVGALQIPGGGQTTEQRIQQILDLGATVLLSTPTYAIRMAETARAMGVDLTSSSVRLAIHAGEPGASIPNTRARLEQAWGMEVFDHPGATEVGAWGFECTEHAGVHLIESEYIFEVVDPSTGEPAEDGELIITNLGRGANPVIRYRTGDRAQLTREICSCGRTFSRLRGGVLGRVDDMLIVRGVNLFPSAIENIVRRFDAVDEFVVEVYRERELDEMEIRLEASQADGDLLVRELASQVHVDLGFRPKVTIAPPGSLPRFELKARRVFDRRG